jgi:hypothetical protein
MTVMDGRTENSPPQRLVIENDNRTRGVSAALRLRLIAAANQAGLTPVAYVTKMLEENVPA